MAFRLPVFNLTCNVWHSPVIPPVGLPALPALQCQLTMDGHLILMGGGFVPQLFTLIKVPPRTDLRGTGSTTGRDVIECPAGTGRYYTAWRVEDVSRGFANEYRLALVLLDGFPTPLP